MKRYTNVNFVILKKNSLTDRRIDILVVHIQNNGSFVLNSKLKSIFFISYFVGYQQFLKDHCVERHYMFQIKKCDNHRCCTPKMTETDFPSVPDPVLDDNNKDHYKPFDAVLGEVTSELHRPSAQVPTITAIAEQMQVLNNSINS